MKDAKGHGSDPRGGPSHMDGVNKIGRVPIQPGVWFHGSPIGEPGPGPIHVGTHQAAQSALEARIGIPADGREWDGTREWGKTLLAGRETQARMETDGTRAKYTTGTGFNSTAPTKDYYPTDRTDEHPSFGGKQPIPYDAKPAIHTYEIAGNMSNNTYHPTTDARANGMAGRLKNQGTYYKNIGEDSGSVSAVVPSKDFLRRRS